jgi:hypothetical protein
MTRRRSRRQWIPDRRRDEVVGIATNRGLFVERWPCSKRLASDITDLVRPEKDGKSALEARVGVFWTFVSIAQIKTREYILDRHQVLISSERYA